MAGDKNRRSTERFGVNQSARYVCADVVSMRSPARLATSASDHGVDCGKTIATVVP
jgi:hypothetical protein